MTLNRQISRIAKLLVDAEGINFPEAESRLRAMTLEINVGPDAASPAGHAAALTAFAVGRRTFLGGVRVAGDLQQSLLSPLFDCATLGDAIGEIGENRFSKPAAMSIGIGAAPEPGMICAWWDGWRAGVRRNQHGPCGTSNNPLAGVAAGAHAVGAAFQTLCGRTILPADVDLWPCTESGPDFAEVYLPSALWLMGLGNLGQAFLWSLAALPYAGEADRHLFLQDYDTVSEENWGTSILVPDDRYGDLKTRMAEAWAVARGFRISRVDRALGEDLRVSGTEPRLALSGFDKVAPRKLLAAAGFEAIVDVGLGRTASDFDRYRVNVFDEVRRIDDHFAGITDPVVPPDAPDSPAYAQLQSEIGRCGAAEIGNASVAVPYVSAIAGATAIARTIAICSAQLCTPGETQRLSASTRRGVPEKRAAKVRSVGHSGRPEFRKALTA